MRHITVSDYGKFLGVSGNRLTVSGADGKTWETALSRVRSIRIEKPGISISSNLILTCAMRGIRLYVTDWRNVAVAAIGGCHTHAVVNVREAQFKCLNSPIAIRIASEIIISKLRNQRAVLLYFSKYLAQSSLDSCETLRGAADTLQDACKSITNSKWEPTSGRWRDELMGLEGQAALVYWKALADSHLLPDSFILREGRGSVEITNAALNYGYTILQSYVWSALDNAGLELYAGILHTKRIGRASLVMDVMEEYRAWVVDRNIIKLRTLLKAKKQLDSEAKKAIVEAIDVTMGHPIAWKGKKIRLENILQRQAYRLVAAIVEGKDYRGIRFKW